MINSFSFTIQRWQASCRTPLVPQTIISTETVFVSISNSNYHCPRHVDNDTQNSASISLNSFRVRFHSMSSSVDQTFIGNYPIDVDQFVLIIAIDNCVLAYRVEHDK